MVNSPLQTLCEFIASLKYEDLPNDVVDKTKVHITDTIGSALAGTCSYEFQQVTQFRCGRPTSSIWGTEYLTSPREAAFINGVASHVFELDDSGGCDHSGSVVIPAALAALSLSEKPVTGKDLIVSIVVGYEVGRRILDSTGGYNAHNSIGWHSTGTCGTLAAASAVAKLLDFDATKCQHAITLATSFSSGLWAFIHDGSQAKKIHAGRAAEGGLLAAQLADKNFTGPSQVFDDVWGGFFKTFNQSSGDIYKLVEELGHDWKVRRATIKPYASCRGAHSSIDALIDLLEENKRLTIDIESIEVELNPMLMNMCGSKSYQSLAATQMSLPYALAAYIVHGSSRLESYSYKKRYDPRIQDCFSKMIMKVNQDMGEMEEPQITVMFKGGYQVSKTVPRATGSAERPITTEALHAKFFSLSKMALPSSEVTTLHQTLMALEQLTDCFQLDALLSLESTQQNVFS
ncbi:MmgE/PrpD family protein [Vibrio sp. DW001]|uniref:MmgE/PrpD family protein n=1 Tax=Vibrio sp. DW001 TaxID=2912315 RepID=UPI0023B00175|nr:MmgE/PrpD family protein [Vibrio sp. DW001]WED25356.1 MmgE/PrpD family protein [Vibrio sp. DW001]